jgi:hypothetical protein
MTRRISFWREILKIWALWVGVGLACIPTGILWVSLLHYGFSQRTAECIALVVGFVLALVLWEVIKRLLADKPKDCYGFTSNIIHFEPAEGALGILVPTPTLVMVTILCVQAYVIQPTQQPLNPPSTIANIDVHAIS